MAARELKRAGRQALVLEAGERVGGRILTLNDTSAGAPVELGAEFVHGDASITNGLLDEARLATVPVLGEHYRSDRGVLVPQGPVWKHMRKVFKRLNPDRKRDRSFQDFLDEKPGGAHLRDARQLARGFVQGFNGADTSLISEKSIAAQGDPTEGAAKASRIVRGYSALIEHLQRDLLDVIHLNAVVKRVIQGDSEVRVFDRQGSEYVAGAVIITVPLPMLQDESIAIEPEIPMLRRAARQLVMGHVLRVNVVVKERFWEDELPDVSYVHTPTRPFNVWWTQHPVRAPLITGWSGGPPAVALAESGEVENVAIRELARAFGTRRDRLEGLIDSINTHDWTRDPSTRGAYSYAGVGGAFAARVLARQFGRCVFLAGEATDSNTSGTVEGALASGKRAARKVMEIPPDALANGPRCP